MPSLVIASGWLFLKRDYLLEYFYFSQLIAITHLLTLGFLSSLMMGVLYRLSPTLLKTPPSSHRLGRVQFVLYFIGIWGMIAHFWLDETRGMSWSTFLVWVASLIQLWNFRKLFEVAGKNRWPARFVGSALVYFVLAASLGVLLGLSKGYGVRVFFLSPHHLDNVFAHAHLAGVGWVTMMIFGVELKLVPTTLGAARFLPVRFALMHLGTIGVGVSFIGGWETLPYAVMLTVACVWQIAGPLRAFFFGRAREWELLPLALLCVASGLGIVLALGHPLPTSPLRGQLQLAYGVLAILGFMVLTVVTVAFKLFPMWVWKERFQEDFGIKPVPGMKDLHSEPLRILASLALGGGVVLSVVAILISSAPLLTPAVGLIVVGVVAFVFNFATVARWGLLKNLDYVPTEADRAKFDRMFPDVR